MSIVGPNGCGKTTLLNLIAGLITPDSGELRVVTPTGTTPRIGYVWQDYRASLLPWYDALDNVTFPLKVKGINKKRRHEVGLAYMKQLIPNVRPEAKLYELSGGQLQLLSLIRSVIVEPDLLLLDEPFAALDKNNSWKMLRTIEKLFLELEIPVFIVTHNLDEAVVVSNSIFLISKKQSGIANVINNDFSRPRSMEQITRKPFSSIRHQLFYQMIQENEKQD